MATDTFRNPVHFQAPVTFGDTVGVTNGQLGNDAIASGAAIDAAKLKHRHHVGYGQANGADVVSETKAVYVAKAAGEVHNVTVRPQTAPTGGDKQFTVDVQKASDGGTYSTILTATIDVDNTSVDNTKQDGTLVGSPTLVAGDSLQVVVTATGSTGSQGQGVIVSIHVDENPA